MHNSELKELIDKKLKKGLDTSYLYESNYGEMSEATFLYRKQTLLINTSALLS